MRIRKCISRALALTAALTVMISSSLATAFADDNLTNRPLPVYGDGEYNENLPRVVDEYDMLSPEEEEYLDEKARKIIDEFGFDCVVLTTFDYGMFKHGYYNERYDDIQTFAHDYFDFMGYGVGTKNDGILFVVSMADRSYAFSTCGYGMEAISDSYGVGWLEDDLVPMLSDGDYYECFDRYFDDVYDFVEEAYENKPYSKLHLKSAPTWLFKHWFASLCISGVITACVVWFLLHQMKTILPKPAAKNYLKNYKEKFAQDTYLYSNVTKTAKSSGSSGGGGGSSGRSHGGSSGHF